VAQDEKSCVVYGMPREAVKIGAASISLNLTQIADLISKIK
jgi:two-component system chemotaxis response regulator CheB